MITMEELELLFSLLARAGCNQIEARWANQIMNKLRMTVTKAQLKEKTEDGDNDE